MRNIFTLCVSLLFVPTFTLKVEAQELPPEGFNPSNGQVPDSIPPQAFQNNPVGIPTSLDSFGSSPISGYNPYQDGSSGSLNFDYYNANTGPNCGWEFSGEARRIESIQDSTQYVGKVSYFTNPCRDHEVLEKLRQQGQNKRSISNNLNTCLQIGDRCPKYVRDALLESVLEK